MIILKLMDGLGNQMFQYAYARFLQTKYNEPIYFEMCKLNKHAVRKYSLCHFKLSRDIVISNRGLQIYFKWYSKVIRLLCERMLNIPMNGSNGFLKMISHGFYTTNDPIAYYPFQYSPKKTKYIRGYFQSYKYFKEIEDIIIDEFEVITPMSSENQQFINNIKNEESVCVHIRRGDYANNPKFEVCNYQYYKKAMDIIDKHVVNPVYYIFSNSHEDIEWIKKNYKFQYDVKYVDFSNPDYEELRLMYSCKHFIISNSTFSWWGAFLSRNNKKIVVAPSIWYRNSTENTKDIYMNYWKIVEV